MLNVTKTCPYKVLKMMSYADFPTVGCLLSWEISKITQRPIANVKSFHNLDTVMSRHKMLCHDTYFSWATELSKSF